MLYSYDDLSIEFRAEKENQILYRAFREGKPMDMAPHPHIGLQTVTWLLEGEVRHDDTLGCEAVARPGRVNVMTAGKGIAHTEQTPAENSGSLNGMQLWVALPDVHR
jgi:quercetin 2,3-dioxygenase